MVFLSKRLRATVTYTGIAGAPTGEGTGPQGTHTWLAQQLCIAEGAGWDAEALTHRIRQEADGWFSTFPKEWVDRRTIFTVAGWDSASTQPRPRGYYVHNCLDERGKMTSTCQPFFAVQALNPSQVDHYKGIEEAVHRGRRKQIRRAVRSGGPTERVVDALVEAFRSAARTTPLVSADCLTVFLPIRGHAESWFHPSGGTPEIYGATVVVCGGEGRLTAVFGDSTSMMPEDWSFSLGDLDGGLGVRVSRGYRGAGDDGPAHPSCS